MAWCRQWYFLNLSQTPAATQKSMSLLGERSYLASTQLLGVRIRRQRSCWALLVRALLVVSNLLVDNTDRGVPYSTRRSMYEEVDVRGTHDERVGLLQLVSLVACPGSESQQSSLMKPQPANDQPPELQRPQTWKRRNASARCCARVDGARAPFSFTLRRL